MKTHSQKMVSVILAGGSGERFWPLSRQNHPKQFLTLTGQRSLIQATHDRLQPLSDQIYVVTNQNHRHLVKQHLPQLPANNRWLEPMARDTAPAILFAALKVRQQLGEDAIMGIFPSDHHIGQNESFQKAVESAQIIASQQPVIVTLGITPTHAATGYGYIKTTVQANNLAHKVEQFVEKPDATRAATFLAEGNYFWNAGMFVFQVKTILEAYRQYAPEMLQILEPAINNHQELTQAFALLEKKSFDYTIMEHHQATQMIPLSCDWDDLGDWNALERLNQSSSTDFSQHIGFDTHGSIVYADQGELVVSIGIDDLIVVRSQNVTLIARKDRSQDIKNVVAQLKNSAQFAQYI